MSFFLLPLLVLAGFLVFALCGNLIYWYETQNSPDARIPSPRPGLFVCLREYALTLGGYFLCVGLFPFGPFLRRKVTAGDKRPPVVCIHGLNNNAAVWLRLARMLDKAGHAVSTYSYSSLFVPFERIIAGLDAHVRAVEAATGQKPVLVCHSLGGLLARHWLGLGSNSGRAAGLITLGTPHGGSKLAVLAPGALARRIVPASPFIRALGAAPPLPLPCVALASPTDEAVLPASGLVPPQGWALRVTAGVGHFSMLFWPSVCAMVVKEVGGMTAD